MAALAPKARSISSDIKKGRVSFEKLCVTGIYADTVSVSSSNHISMAFEVLSLDAIYTAVSIVLINLASDILVLSLNRISCWKN